MECLLLTLSELDGATQDRFEIASAKTFAADGTGKLSTGDQTNSPGVRS
jgi:hypothetical protein